MEEYIRVIINLDIGHTKTVTTIRVADGSSPGYALPLGLPGGIEGAPRPTEVYLYRQVDGTLVADATKAVLNQEPPVATFRSFKALLSCERAADVPELIRDQLGRSGLTAVDDPDGRLSVRAEALGDDAGSVRVAELFTALIGLVLSEAVNAVSDQLMSPDGARYELNLSAPANVPERYHAALIEAARRAFEQVTERDGRELTVTVVPEPVAAAAFAVQELQAVRRPVPKLILLFERGGLTSQLALYSTFESSDGTVSCRQLMYRTADLGGLLEDAEVHRFLSGRFQGDEAILEMLTNKKGLEEALKREFSRRVTANRQNGQHLWFDMARFGVEVDPAFKHSIAKNPEQRRVSWEELNAMFERAQSPLAEFLVRSKPAFDACTASLEPHEVGFILAGGGGKCAGIKRLVMRIFGIAREQQLTELSAASTAVVQGLDWFVQRRPDVAGTVYKGDKRFLGFAFRYEGDDEGPQFVKVINPEGPYVGCGLGARFVLNDEPLQFHRTARTTDREWVSEQNQLVQWLRSDGIPEARPGEEHVRLEDLKGAVLMTFDVRVHSDECPDGDPFSLVVEVSDQGDVSLEPLRNGRNDGVPSVALPDALGPAAGLGRMPGGGPSDDEGPSKRARV